LYKQEKKKMESRNEERNALSAVSRRGLLKGSMAIAAAWSAPTPAPAQTGGPVYAYIGTYNPNGVGIYIYRMDTTTGILTPTGSVADASPSSIAIAPSGKYLYAVNEISNFMGTTTGSVTAYSIDRATGKLTKLNAVSSGSGGPAHVGVDATGKWVFAANYGGGNFAVLPINTDGSVGAYTDLQAAIGPLGPTTHPGRPPGTFANSGHDAHHAHMAATDPSNKYVLHTDLGSDELTVWNFDAVAGKLTRNNVIKSLPGGGPRHFSFHSNGRWVYTITEEDSTLLFSTFDPATGKLTPTTFISTLPDNFSGTNYTSEVGVSADGRFVYGLNRLYNSIALFSIDQATGIPTLVSNEWTRGDYPRLFAIDPSGNFMYVLNQRSDSAAAFSINQTTGAVTFTGQIIAVGMPSGMAFLAT
jgi:6-phosphogluconolactonase (cycloisomerase 2 family)